MKSKYDNSIEINALDLQMSLNSYEGSVEASTEKCSPSISEDEYTKLISQCLDASDTEITPRSSNSNSELEDSDSERGWKTPIYTTPHCYTTRPLPYGPVSLSNSLSSADDDGDGSNTRVESSNIHDGDITLAKIPVIPKPVNRRLFALKICPRLVGKRTCGSGIYKRGICYYHFRKKYWYESGHGKGSRNKTGHSRWSK